MQFIIEKKLGYLPESYQVEEYCYNHKTEQEKADYERKLHAERAEQQKKNAETR